MSFVSKSIIGTLAVEDALNGSDEFFRYCEFSSASLEGGSFDGIFVSSSFTNVEWYWGLFNSAVLVDCKFENCTFRGTSFSSCRFVNCEFKNCRFLPDNLHASCKATSTSLYDCQSIDCEGFGELFPSPPLES